MDKVKIAMWSGPRNISTAMMRSFENRTDTFVIDEPFYAFYLKETGHNHPHRDEILKSQSVNYKKIVEICLDSLNDKRPIFYQKHMSHHMLDKYNLDWIKGIKNCFLIRDPQLVISSFNKKFLIKSAEQLGYKQQYKIYNIVKNYEDPIIIDSKDILENPEILLRKLCKKLKIKFEKQMLIWPPGRRKTDGIWAPYWYKNVFESTSFVKSEKRGLKLSESLKDIYLECMEYYNVLKKLSLKP